MAQGWRGSYARYREFFLNISSAYKKRSDVRAFLEITLSLLTIIIFLVFALKPTAITIIDLSQQIRERRTTLSTLTQKVADLQKASNILQENQNTIADINIAVPDMPNPDILSQQVEGMAIKYSVNILGISINKISLTPQTLSEVQNEMPFSISIDGSYSNIISFIHNFENMRISSKIDTLNVSSSVTDKGLVVVGTITGRVPFIGK